MKTTRFRKIFQCNVSNFGSFYGYFDDLGQFLFHLFHFKYVATHDPGCLNGLAIVLGPGRNDLWISHITTIGTSFISTNTNLTHCWFNIGTSSSTQAQH